MGIRVVDLPGEKRSSNGILETSWVLADRENMPALVEHGFPYRVCAGRYSKLGRARALQCTIDCMEAMKMISRT